jgi:hypothetical protein
VNRCTDDTSGRVRSNLDPLPRGKRPERRNVIAQVGNLYEPAISGRVEFELEVRMRLVGSA